MGESSDVKNRDQRSARAILWKVSGPLLTAAIAVTIEVLSHSSLKIPNPPAFLLLTVVFSAFTGGVISGQSSALIAWFYIAYFFSTPSGSFHYTDENLRRVIVWAFTTPAMALMVGILKRRADWAQAERARLESEARKGAILEAALDCIISIDHEGRVIDFNPAAEQTFGYSRAQVVGKEMAELLIPPGLRERHRRGMAHYLATGEGPVLGKRIEMPAMRADGTEFPIELAVTRIQLDGPPMFTAYVRDLTEHKRAEAIRQRSLELEDQYRRVQEANRLKSEFLANMSHELRTPLNAIIGFAELMHDGRVGPVSAEHKEFLGDILTSSHHLLQLINDVLDLAKVESGKMEFRPEAVDLARLVSEVRDILRTLMAQKRIRVQAEIDPTLPRVVVDPGKLKQVLYNYLSNALKFTPDEGRVTVRVMPEGPDAFRLEVEDTGIGIKPEDQERLFVEFQQLDTSAAKKYSGTGLGLALTKRIVEAQGGRVGIRSTPGKGSVFFAVLPRVARALPEAEAAPAPAPPAVGQPGAPTILIIEDDTRDRAWLQQTLSAAGYAVAVAATGAEGLTRCRERPFDAITLDLLLPDMNGSEVLEAIRAGGPNRDVPVIVATVVAERAAVRSFPVHDFLPKPVQAETLLASLTRAGITPDGSRKILVVDDDPHALKLMQTTLAQLGFQPICTADAESGLRAAAQERLAAVVLDLLMPGMDGFTFLERLRRTATGRRTPVIVWTVKDLSADERRRLKGSAQAVVQKGQGGTAALLAQLQTYVSAARE